MRGSRYWWRKKMTVGGVRLPLGLPLGAMNFTDARVTALRLGSAEEALRMGYGPSSGVSPDQLKKVFSDALRWQLQRILEDQFASSTAAVDHASLNSPYAEAWTFLSKQHQVGGAWKDKDVYSFRRTATSMLKGVVPDSVRCNIFGHEGETEKARTFDDEADLSIKLEALKHLTPLTEHIPPVLPIRIRPANRLKFGGRIPSRLGRTKAGKA
ncbi:hypothetical protein ACM61V_17055 [Sphingomonas sp. TX0543]|uniref:hypothetical protein n=2 Tax=unclassified Sphingomonas TaxID=196159 RepID=UPI001484DE0E